MRFVCQKIFYMKLLKLLFILSLLIVLSAFKPDKTFKKEVIATLKIQILSEAEWATQQMPITITAESSSRSTGGKNDFYSEEIIGGQIQINLMALIFKKTD